MEVVVALDEEHAVACGDTKERDETDDGGDTDVATREPQHKHTAHESQGEVDENNGRLGEAAELIVEQQVDDHDGKERGYQEGARCVLLVLKLSAILDVVVFGQFDLLLDDATHVGNHAAEVTPSHIGRDNDLTLHILTVDRVGAY